MTIKFLNGRSFEYVDAYEEEEYYNGQSRRMLRMICNVGVISVDELNELLSNEENTKSIMMTVEDEDGSVTTGVYTGYVLKAKCSIETIIVQKETSEHPAIYEDRLIFKLGRRTYIEEQLAALGVQL